MKFDLKLDWCSYRAARFAVKRWHYSKRMPLGKLVKIGVWENSEYKGVILFGRGATPNIGKPYNLEQTKVCELVRIALKEHENPVTKIVSIVIKMLKKRCPGLYLIISYSDLDENHLGKIYQAGNWIYTGLTMKNSFSGFIINNNLVRSRTFGKTFRGNPSKKIMHPRSVRTRGIIQSLPEVRKYIDPNAEKFYTKGKHKYLMPLTKQMREQIEPLAQPYPKCLESIENDASVLPDRNESGVIPTSRLHLNA